MALSSGPPRENLIIEKVEMPKPGPYNPGKPWDNFNNALRNVFCKPDNPFRDPTTPSLCDL
jgi:hypothetical protein